MTYNLEIVRAGGYLERTTKHPLPSSLVNQIITDAQLAETATIAKLRDAITVALHCTPSIGQKYVGISGLVYRPVIQYDCGDPWAILREALEETKGTE